MMLCSRPGVTDLRHAGCAFSKLPYRPAPQICRSRQRQVLHRDGRCRAAQLDFDALLFDCDGVLCDTEAEGHRVSVIVALPRPPCPSAPGLLLSSRAGSIQSSIPKERQGFDITNRSCGI